MFKPHCRAPRQLLSTMFMMIVLLVVGVDSALADELAVWNFNDSDLVVDHGSGSLVSNFVATNILFAAGTTNNARLGDIAGQALSLQGGTSNTNNGRNITFNVSTVGFTNILVSFATQDPRKHAVKCSNIEVACIGISEHFLYPFLHFLSCLIGEGKSKNIKGIDMVIGH